MRAVRIKRKNILSQARMPEVVSGGIGGIAGMALEVAAPEVFVQLADDGLNGASPRNSLARRAAVAISISDVAAARRTAH